MDHIAQNYPDAASAERDQPHSAYMHTSNHPTFEEFSKNPMIEKRDNGDAGTIFVSGWEETGCIYYHFDEKLNLTMVAWARAGNYFHANNKPSRLYYHNGVLQAADYTNSEGKLHRLDGPAQIRYSSKDGHLQSQAWHNSGIEANKDVSLPSVLIWHQNGTIREAIWHIASRYKGRKDNKPARYIWDEEGNLLREEWYYQNYLGKDPKDMPKEYNYRSYPHAPVQMLYKKGILDTVVVKDPVSKNNDDPFETLFYNEWLDLFWEDECAQDYESLLREIDEMEWDLGLKENAGQDFWTLPKWESHDHILEWMDNIRDCHDELVSKYHAFA